MAHTVWSRKLRKIKSQIDGDILITHVSSAMWSNNCCYKAKREFRLKTVLLKQHEGLWRWDIETWSGKSSLSESIYVIEAGTYNLTTQSTVVADSGCLKGRGQKKKDTSSMWWGTSVQKVLIHLWWVCWPRFVHWKVTLYALSHNFFEHGGSPFPIGVGEKYDSLSLCLHTLGGLMYLALWAIILWSLEPRTLLLLLATVDTSTKQMSGEPSQG